MAMLAYQPSLRIGYELVGTAVSFAAAVIGMTAGFALPAWRRTRSMDLIGGTVTGSSVAVLHYIGIAAIRTQADMQTCGSWPPPSSSARWGAWRPSRRAAG
jgi:NO-binding membrane sensor protein with MHYT domain